MIDAMTSPSSRNVEPPFVVGATVIANGLVIVGSSQQHTVDIGKALVDRISSEMRPVVIPLSGQPFDANPLESEHGPISACMVLPCYVRAQLVHHLVLFVGGGTGTLEVWGSEASLLHSPMQQLRLASGYFGKLHEFFRLTAATRFRCGEGLPGRAAATRDCVVFADLALSTAFLRANAAKSVGLSCGFAFPVHHPTGYEIATILLGARDAQSFRVDVWAATSQIEHVQTYLEGSAAPVQRSMAERLAELIGRTGAPNILAEHDVCDNRIRAAWGWIAPGSASIPRILTVVP